MVQQYESRGATAFNKKMVEMTIFEELGLLGRELGHAGDFP